MLGIKKMLKDDDATGIVGALSACLPSSVIGGGIGAIITLFGTICAALIGFLPAAYTVVCTPFFCGCGTGCCTGLFTLIESAICCGVPLMLDALLATCVGGLTSCAAAGGALLDYFVAIAPCTGLWLTSTAPCITACLTPAIGVIAAALSAVIGAFGCSLGAGTGFIGMIFGNLGQNVGAM